MYSSLIPAQYTRIAGDTTEHAIMQKRGILFGIVPSNTTVGTVTIKDAHNVADGTAITMDVAAIGLTQVGKEYGPYGVELTAGLTIQLSSASDSILVIWAPYNQ